MLSTFTIGQSINTELLPQVNTIVNATQCATKFPVMVQFWLSKCGVNASDKYDYNIGKQHDSIVGV